MRLWFVRHGETEHNIQRVFQGQLDTALTDFGREQAKQTARALEDVPFDRIFCSDLRRAFDTAECIAAGRDVGVEPEVRLREMHYGVLQGVAYADFREVLRTHGVDSEWGSGVFSEDGTAPPGGESLADLVARTSAFIAELRELANPADNIAVVTHGGTIRTIMTELLEMKPTMRSAIALANCGVTCFSNTGDSWQLEFHNRVYWASGLEAPPATV